MSSAINAIEPAASTGTAIRRGNSATRTGSTLGDQVTMAAAANNQKGNDVGIQEKSN